MTALAWTPAQVRATWRLPVAATVGLMALLLLAYRGTAMAMFDIWMRSETFTHCIVVPPIVAWLIWRKRGELAPLQPRPMPLLLLPMAGLAFLWWLGHIVNVAAATHLALVAMLVAVVPLVLGWQTTRTLAFPLAFMFFAVPIGEFMTPTLMHWTAEALVGGLRLTGIPVYQEGQHLVIPSGRWAVVEACSGVRYLMATFMVGSLFAYLNYSGTRKRLIFVAVSLVLPILANWVRAYVIVMLGHLSNNQIATGVDHLVYGWVFFGVVILALFFIGARWADPDGLEADAAAAGRAARDRAEVATGTWQVGGTAALAAAVMLWPVWLAHHQAASAAAQPPVRLALPGTLGAWQAAELPAQDWAPNFPAATVRQARVYAAAQGQVAVHIAYYRGETDDVKLVSSINSFTTDHPWHVLSDGATSVQTSGRPVHWRQAVLTSLDGGTVPGNTRPQLTVWRLYWLGGPLAHSDVQAKLLQAWGALRGEPDDGAALHLVSALPDVAAAQQQLSAFVTENFAMLERTLAQARESR
ncbi:MAG: exosortase A [Aquabacterium sp.]|nr:exosortase A [Aquabacterium sp.]